MEYGLPDYALPPYRWIYGPCVIAELFAEAAGLHRVLIAYRNPHEGQRLHLRCNGTACGSFDLHHTGIGAGRILVANVPLETGQTSCKSRSRIGAAIARTCRRSRSSLPRSRNRWPSPIAWRARPPRRRCWLVCGDLRGPKPALLDRNRNCARRRPVDRNRNTGNSGAEVRGQCHIDLIEAWGRALLACVKHCGLRAVNRAADRLIARSVPDAGSVEHKIDIVVGRVNRNRTQSC